MGGLARVLRAKYGQLCRQFCSEDGKVQHTVVLNELDLSVFGLVSVDQREGSLAIVHKDEQMPMVDGFLEGFVEAAAFHLWAGLVWRDRRKTLQSIRHIYIGYIYLH